MKKLQCFKSEQFEIFGMWDEPDNMPADKKYPGIILCHGFTGNHIESRRLYTRLTESLQKKGILVYRFDYRGSGDSSGDFIDFTADGFLKDLKGALNAFLSHPNLDKDRMMVLGYSLGGISASYLLSMGVGFKAACLWAPVAFPDLLAKRIKKGAGLDENKPVEKYIENGGFRVSPQFLDNIDILTPLRWIKPYQGPVHVFHGDKDNVVEKAQGQAYIDERKHEGDSLTIIEGGDHGFGTSVIADGLLEKTRKILFEYLLEQK